MSSIRIKRRGRRVLSPPMVPFIKADKPSKVSVFQPAPILEGETPHTMSESQLWTWMMGMSTRDRVKRGAFARTSRDLVWHRRDDTGEEHDCPVPIPAGSVVNVVFAGTGGDLGITTELDVMYGYQVRKQAVELWLGDDATERLNAGEPADILPDEGFLDIVLPYYVTSQDIEGVQAHDFFLGGVTVLTVPNPEAWDQALLYSLFHNPQTNA